jgi:hypothetical protein
LDGLGRGRGQPNVGHRKEKELNGWCFPLKLQQKKQMAIDKKRER